MASKIDLELRIARDELVRTLGRLQKIQEEMSSIWPTDFWHTQFLLMWEQICEAAGIPTDTNDPNYIGVDQLCKILQKVRGVISEEINLSGITSAQLGMRH